MTGVLVERVEDQRRIERAIVQGSARMCSSNFGKVCKALWPLKTAEHLASIIGCSIRAAAYEISGEREPSALSILAVMDAITPRRGHRAEGKFNAQYHERKASRGSGREAGRLAVRSKPHEELA